MVLVYRDPFEQFQAELERMLERAFGTSGVYPPVNVFDQGDAFVVKAELPGVGPEKIELSVEDDALTLRGERTFPAPSEDGAYHRRERGEGQFRRVVRMPGRLAADEARAEYRDGVFTVRIPKAKEAQPRRVEIQAG